MTERLHFHFSLSYTGEGNGNPLQCSCLENPRDGGAWWAAIYGVAQSRTRLKQLSSSSSSILYWCFSFWLTSLCIIGSSFIHLIRTDSNVFFLMAESHRTLVLEVALEIIQPKSLKILMFKEKSSLSISCFFFFFF